MNIISLNEALVAFYKSVSESLWNDCIAETKEELFEFLLQELSDLLTADSYIVIKA